MKRDAIFRFRLSGADAERLEREATEEGLSKADLIRRRLGWDITALPTRDMSHIPISVTEEEVDPETRPGASALQQLAKRLGRKP